MNVLVTGGVGFVGSHLAHTLQRGGHKVTVVDSFTDYYDVKIKRARAEGLEAVGVAVIERDIAAMGAELLEGIDCVFHLAGQPGVRKSWGSDFALYVRENVLATQALLELVRDQRVPPKVVYASSSSVYGSAESYPTTETTLPRPRSPYGVTKLAAEHLVSLYAENFGLDTVSLRYFTVYGPGQRPDMAFTRFIRAILTGHPVSIYGDGRQVRDFTYVDDVVRANILTASSEVLSGASFNVCGGCSSSVNEVISLLEEITGRRAMLRYLPGVEGDVERTGGDSTIFRDATGWEPRVDLRRGLTAQVKWMQKVLG